MGLELIFMLVTLITVMWTVRVRAPYKLYLKNESYRKPSDGLTYPCVVVYVGRRLHSNPLIVKRLYAKDIKEDDEALIVALADARATAIRLNSAMGKRPKQLNR